MKIYLDDDSANPLLAKLLRAAGHDVQLPGEVRKRGFSDPAQFAHAIRENRLLLSGNHDDFQDLHDLVIVAGGHHPGVLMVRKDNDTRRDFTPRAIVRAIENVAAGNVPTADSFIILNHYR